LPDETSKLTIAGVCCGATHVIEVELITVAVTILLSSPKRQYIGAWKFDPLKVTVAWESVWAVVGLNEVTVTGAEQLIRFELLPIRYLSK
jgi:hypothetical protein